MVSRECWEDVGGFDTRYFPGNFDDNDWCRRACEKGWGLAIAAGSYIHHIGQETFRSQGMDYQKAMTENRERFIEKWAVKDKMTRSVEGAA